METTTSNLRFILSLDGGGIRGILTGQVLIALERKLNEALEKQRAEFPDARPIRLAQCFDLVAGTSTGGILSCMLLSPSETDPNYPRFTAEEAVQMYLEYGPQIFKKTTSGRLPGFFSGILGAKFGSENIEDILKKYLGEIRLSQMIKPCLITSYDIQQRKAVFFTSHDAETKPNSDFKLWQVARSTSAAPTYFPPATAEAGSQFIYHTIDGGLFANNPTMCAVIEAMKVLRDNQYAVLAPDKMFILSIGTGAIQKSYPYDQARGWGLLRWIMPIIDIMMSGVSETVDYQLMKLFKTLGVPQQYHRIMPDLGGASPEMDDVSPKNLDALRQAGIKCADDNDEKLDTIAAKLFDHWVVSQRKSI
ncbi:MAG: patatin-like phospholipase family protein [Chitinophagales bacterium]|nr:patatin-like phospholipase family protein [Chitinophagales bacterium]